MELRVIQVFALVAKYRSFSKVADNLFLSQSSISKYISSLERELGHELFHRNTKNVTLTEFGREFLPHAQAMLEEEERSLAFIQSYNTRTVSNFYTLGVASSLSFAPADSILYQLIRAVEALKTACPEAVLRLKYMPDEELFPALSSANVDIVLFSSCKSSVSQMVPENCVHTSLCDEPNYLLYPADWGEFHSLREIQPFIRSLSMAPDPTPRVLTGALCNALNDNIPIRLCDHWSAMLISLMENQSCGVTPRNILPLATECGMGHLLLDERFISCLNLAWLRNRESGTLMKMVDTLQRVLDEKNNEKRE